MSRKIKIIRVPLDLGQERRGVDMGPSARVAGLNARVRALGLASGFAYCGGFVGANAPI
jgi:arginase family enzyme